MGKPIIRRADLFKNHVNIFLIQYGKLHPYAINIPHNGSRPSYLSKYYFTLDPRLGTTSLFPFLHSVGSSIVLFVIGQNDLDDVNLVDRAAQIYKKLVMRNNLSG